MEANSGHLDGAVILNCASLNGFVVLSLARAPFFCFCFVFSCTHAGGTSPVGGVLKRTRRMALKHFKTLPVHSQVFPVYF